MVFQGEYGPDASPARHGSHDDRSRNVWIPLSQERGKDAQVPLSRPRIHRHQFGVQAVGRNNGDASLANLEMFTRETETKPESFSALADVSQMRLQLIQKGPQSEVTLFARVRRRGFSHLMDRLFQ